MRCRVFMPVSRLATSSRHSRRSAANSRSTLRPGSADVMPLCTPGRCTSGSGPLVALAGQEPAHQGTAGADGGLTVVGEDELEAPVLFGAGVADVAGDERSCVVGADQDHRPLTGQWVIQRQSGPADARGGLVG